VAQCPFRDQCPFFGDRTASMPSTTEWLTRQFCCGRFDQCARHMVRSTLGREAVPLDLFPDDVRQARQILHAAREDQVSQSDV
jgi:hypothetical protein